MKVRWDPKKAKINLRKHGISFSDAENVLYDPIALTIEEHDVSGEERFVTLGADPFGRVLVVVYTYRSEEIRIISARKAARKERIDYEEGI